MSALMVAEDLRHGTYNGYTNLHCRCERCKRANTEVHNAYVSKHRTLVNRINRRSRKNTGKTLRTNWYRARRLVDPLLLVPWSPPLRAGGAWRLFLALGAHDIRRRS